MQSLIKMAAFTLWEYSESVNAHYTSCQFSYTDRHENDFLESEFGRPSSFNDDTAHWPHSRIAPI